MRASRRLLPDGPGRGKDQATCHLPSASTPAMIRKLKSGEYRIYSRKKDASTGKRRNLGTFATREKAEKHERAIQFFKKH
jgi:hypothetical protein